MRAPAPAMVKEIAGRSAGSVVRVAETLFTLVPLDVPLEAEVRITPRDIGFVRGGDAARIKLDAFSFQKHGTLDGKVRSISEDVHQVRSGGGSEPEVYYLARLELTKTQLKVVPDDFRLIPGMTLSAEIPVGKRSVISYFIYPIVRALDESIREP